MLFRKSQPSTFWAQWLSPKCLQKFFKFCWSTVILAYCSSKDCHRVQFDRKISLYQERRSFSLPLVLYSLEISKPFRIFVYWPEGFNVNLNNNSKVEVVGKTTFVISFLGCLIEGKVNAFWCNAETLQGLHLKIRRGIIFNNLSTASPLGGTYSLIVPRNSISPKWFGQSTLFLLHHF